MPVFQYVAIDGAGERVAGRMEAQSADAVVQRLQESGHLPIEARELAAGAATAPAARGARLFGGRGPSRKDVTLLTRNLAMLVAAGHPLEQALDVLARDQSNAETNRMLDAILADVRGGRSLSDAIEPHADRFGRLYVNMVRAGEASGTLGVVLERLAEYRESSERLRETVQGALFYPAILVTAALVSVILLLTFVVPQFERIFAEAHAELPTPTAIVIGAGRLIRDQGLVLSLILLLLLLLGRRIMARPPVRLARDRLLLRLPFIGELARASVTARFSRTLGALLENGVNLPTALGLVRDVVGNRHAAESFDRVIGGVREGRFVADMLSEGGVLPGAAVRMLRVGEETGNLAPAALHVASFYERRLDTAVRRLLTLLEPALIVFIGVMVGGIIFSILLAVVGLNELAT